MLRFTQHHLFFLKKKSGAGFTLIELLIVAAVFSVAFLLATSVFVGVQANQRGVAGRQRVVADGRYILEAMVRTVRLGSIDYLYYRDPDGNLTANPDNLRDPQPLLAVRDQQGIQTCYRWLGTKLQTISNQASCFYPNLPGTDITPSDIVVTKFQVYISPQSDPYQGPRTSSLDCNSDNPTSDGVCVCDDIGSDGSDDDRDDFYCLPEQRCVAPALGGQEICLNVNRHPTVTIVLETRSANTASGEQSSIALQTTVTPRTIRR